MSVINNNTSVVAQFRDFVSHFQDVDSQDTISIGDGRTLRRRTFESEFHRKVDREIHDPEKAEIIAKSFTQHLRSVMQKDEVELFEAWILKNIRYLGFFPFDQYWIGETEKPITILFSKYTENLSAFFEEIRCAEQPSNFPLVRNIDDPLNVVVITTTGGGGHKSVADALAQILNQYPLKYRVTIIDIADVGRPSDPVYVASGLLSVDDVYDKIYQQAKETHLANQIWQLKPKLNDFIADTSMKDLKDRIRLLNPDLVISSCHFWERDLEVASSLCVPLRFIHCDYELSWALLPVIANANPKVVKLWLPATDPEILRPASSQLKSELVSQLRLSHSEEEIDQLLIEKVQASVDYSGYPVRSSFKRKTEPNEIQAIRERFQIEEGAQVVTIQMGKQGVGTIKDVVRILNEDETVVYSRPLHLAVMCGTNDKMREDLLEYLTTHKNHSQIRFDIRPLMNQQDTADFLNVTDVEIMKPGGAATAEALQLKVKTLFQVTSEHPWEVCNGNQMARHKVGEKIESLEKLPAQLKEELEKTNQADYDPIPADEVIPRLIDEAVKVFDVYHRDNIATDAVFERTSPENVRKIYEMLQALHEIMTKHDIKYWMDGGTILGADRNGGLIPWDDDGDLEIHEADKEKLLSLTEEFTALGYKLVDHELGLKLFPKESYFPSIDVFTVVKDEESGNYMLSNEKARKLWPKEFWTEEELSEIVPYAFGPIKLMGCKKADRYLTTLYGKNYKDVAYQLYDHERNRLHHKVAVRVVDRTPARIDNQN